MAAIGVGLRGGGIAILLVLALLLWRDGRRTAARYGVLFMLCAASYLVESAPGLVFTQPAWIVPLRVMSVIAPAVFLLWTRATFDDGFRPSWIAWLPTAGMAALAAWAMAVDRWLPWRIVNSAALILVGASVWQVLGGREGDLVEGRRRFRPVLAIGAALAIVALTILGATSNRQIRAYGSVVSAALVVALAAASATLRLGLRDRPDAAIDPSGGEASASFDPRAKPAVALDPDERALLERLRRLMEEERAYREEGLGIAALAGRLGLPEYRLRRLINQRLGHRNFTSFVNGYRLAEAIAALADPGQAQVPVLTIALDAGFQSIGPFNRAFKAQTGMTPTDFRRERLEPIAPHAAA